MKGNNRKLKLVALFTSMSLLIILALVTIPLFAFGYVDALIYGPDAILEVPSPDGQYLAYVIEAPSIDPPNQSLMIERNNKSRFLSIAKLSEDIDSIKEIMWSPDSSIVVYHSFYYLTATRISDWQTLRIYLGVEWKRHKPVRRTTFSSAGPRHEVKAIRFPESGCFTYQLMDSDKIHKVRMDLLTGFQ